MTMTKKTFSDLVFNDHANTPNGVQAKLDLGNNLEVSVVSMKDKEAEFGLLSVISGAIDNAEKLEQNPASLAGAAGVSLTDFLPAPPSRE